jgi:hypothetical protein
MQLATQAASISKKMLWAGRVISALPALFLLWYGIMKLVKPQFVAQAIVDMGYP